MKFSKETVKVGTRWRYSNFTTPFEIVRVTDEKVFYSYLNDTQSKKIGGEFERYWHEHDILCAVPYEPKPKTTKKEPTKPKSTTTSQIEDLHKKVDELVNHVRAHSSVLETHSEVLDELGTQQTKKQEETKMSEDKKTKSERIIKSTKLAGIMGMEILAGTEAVDTVFAGIEEILGVGKREGFMGLKDSKWAQVYKVIRADPKLDALLRGFVSWLMMNAAIMGTDEDEDGNIIGAWSWIPDLMAELGVHASEAALAVEMAKGGKIALDTVKPTFLKGVAEYRAKLNLPELSITREKTTEKDELAKARAVQAKRQGSM